MSLARPRSRTLAAAAALSLLALAVPAGAEARTPPRPVKAAVSITSLASGGTLQGGTDLISGTARQASYVHLTFNGELRGGATVDKRGTWTTTPGQVFPAGAGRLCAQVRNSLGTPLATDCVDITVKADPAALSIVTPVDGSIVDLVFDAQTTCYPGTVVRLTLDGRDSDIPPLDCSTVDGTAYGMWMEAATTPGSHTVRAEMLDQGAVVATATSTVTIPGAQAPTVERR